MNDHKSQFAILLLIVSLSIPQKLHAHHSPSEVIEALTTRIENGERTSKILTRRADEYRTLGNQKLALADYLAALELNKTYHSAIYGLAKTYLAQKNYQAAIKSTQHGIQTSAAPDQAAPFHAVAARAYQQQNSPAAALTAWQQALTSTRPEVDWYLGHSQTLEQLGKPDESRLALEIAMQKNPSVVLQRAWIESLIHCGDTQTAAIHIQAGLARARWKSSWLLLQAKLYLAQNQPTAAQQAAQSALAEITSRQRPNTKNQYLTTAQEQAESFLTQITTRINN